MAAQSAQRRAFAALTRHVERRSSTSSPVVFLCHLPLLSSPVIFTSHLPQSSSFVVLLIRIQQLITLHSNLTLFLRCTTSIYLSNLKNVLLPSFLPGARALHTTAENHRVRAGRQAALWGWQEVAEAARGARLRTEIAVAHAAGCSQRRAFIEWVFACEEARGEALAVDHCDETRLRNGFNALWGYVVAQRHKEAQRRAAVRHRYVRQ